MAGSGQYCQSLIDHDYQSSVSPDISSSNFDCGVEGFSFVAGYYAHKLKSEFPELGQKTCNAPKYGNQTSIWINALSRGGLVQPSKSFLLQLKDFEIEFGKFHGNKINPCKNVISKFSDILASKFSDIPQPIIKKYARTRTFIRLHHLNKEITKQNFDKRKEKQLKQFKN